MARKLIRPISTALEPRAHGATINQTASNHSLHKKTSSCINREASRSLTDAVIDPRAVMIELGDTATTDGAVFGTDRFMNDARVTELAEVERVTLRQIKYHLRPFTSPPLSTNNCRWCNYQQLLSGFLTDQQVRFPADFQETFWPKLSALCSFYSKAVNKLNEEACGDRLHPTPITRSIGELADTYRDD